MLELGSVSLITNKDSGFKDCKWHETSLFPDKAVGDCDRDGGRNPVVVVVLWLLLGSSVSTIFICWPAVGGGRNPAAGVVDDGNFFRSLLSSDEPPAASYQAASLQCSLHLQPGRISRLVKRGESKKRSACQATRHYFQLQIKGIC